MKQEHEQTLLAIAFALRFLTLEKAVRLAQNLSRSFRAAVQSCNLFWESLDFSSNSNSHGRDAFRSLVQSSLSENGRLIQGVNFSFCEWLTDEDLEVLASSDCKNLKVFILRQCTGITDSGLKKLTTIVPQLERLDLYCQVTISDESVTLLLSTGGKTLRHLDLAGSKNLTCKTMEAITKYCADLQHADFTRMPALTGTSVGHVAKSCVRLRTLRFYANQTLGYEAFENLYKLTDLQHLDLCGTAVRDCDMVKFAASCPHIRILDLSFCLNLSSETLYALASMDDSDGLRWVSLFGNRNYSVDAFDRFLGSVHAKFIEAIDIRGCVALQKWMADDFAELRKALPRCKQLYLHS